MDDPLFTGEDLRLIESLVYRPELKPSYEFLKDCLIWEDERPDGLTPSAYENLCDLWIARSHIHRGEPISSRKRNAEHFESIWNRALEQAFEWPGFNRMSLSPEDAAYYQKSRTEEL